MTSTNERAERLMGRRLTPEQEQTGVVPFDLPCELGYWCPVHRCVMDERLEWSEYAGFLWCAACDRDYPSALCVPLDTGMTPDPARPWWKVGVAAAIEVFLDTVEAAVLSSPPATPAPHPDAEAGET